MSKIVRLEYCKFLQKAYLEILEQSRLRDVARLSGWDAGAPAPKELKERLERQLDALEKDIESGVVAISDEELYDEHA